MLRPKPPQSSFYGSYLYDKIVPADHLLRKINQVVDFSFVHELVKDRYTPDFGRPGGKRYHPRGADADSSLRSERQKMTGF
jgi:hypothetical protein